MPTHIIRHLSLSNAFKVHVSGSHLNVTDLPLISPLMASLILSAAPGNDGAQVDAYAAMEQTNALVLEFFNAYLKGEGSFSPLEGSRP